MLIKSYNEVKAKRPYLRMKKEIKLSNIDLPSNKNFGLFFSAFFAAAGVYSFIGYNMIVSYVFFASSLFLFGSSLLYGFTGSISFDDFQILFLNTVPDQNNFNFSYLRLKERLSLHDMKL